MRKNVGWSFCLSAGLLVLASACGGGEASAPRAHDANSNKVLNLCAASESHLVLDVRELNRSGLIDLLKKNLNDKERKDLDRVTRDMGSDPFQALSVFAIWGKGFDDPQNLTMAVTTDLPADKVDKALKFLEKEFQKSGSSGSRGDPGFNIALLGDIKKDSVVTLMKQSAKSFKAVSADGDISYYEADGTLSGVVDHKGMFSGRSKEAIKGLSNAISSASSSASTLLKGGDLLRFNVVINKDGLAGVSGNVTTQKDGWTVFIHVATDNADMAKGIGGQVHMALGFLMKARDKMDPKLREALDKVNVDIKDRDVKITLNIPKSVAQ